MSEFNNLVSKLQTHLKEKPKEWGISLPGDLAKKISQFSMPT